jgi:hypothetical protein
MSANKLKYEFVPESYDVISYGEDGNKFYISLHGELGVYLPWSKLENPSSLIDNNVIIDFYLFRMIKSNLKKNESNNYLLPPRDIMSQKKFEKVANIQSNFCTESDSSTSLVKSIEGFKS